MKGKGKPKSEMAEVLDIVNFVKNRMLTKDEGATKEDIAGVKKEMAAGFLRVEERLYAIEQELKDIKRRLAKLEDSYEAVKVYGANIRELQSRVRALEKQLAARR